MTRSEATITRDGRDGVVATDFDAETKTLLGCGGHNELTGTKCSGATLIKNR